MTTTDDLTSGDPFSGDLSQTRGWVTDGRSCRPFGMRFLTSARTMRPDTEAELDPRAYDLDRQISLTHRGDPWTLVAGLRAKESTTDVSRDGIISDETDPY